ADPRKRPALQDHHLGQRHRVPWLQGTRASRRDPLLLRLPAPPMATREQRKLQRLATTVLPQTKKPCQSTARPLRHHRPQAQPQAKETIWLQVPDRATRRTTRGVALRVLIHPKRAAAV